MAGEELNPQVVLTADVSAYEQNIRSAERTTGGLLDSVNRLAETMARLNSSAGRNIQLVGAGTTAGLVGATAAAARFQQQMQQLEASATLTNRSLRVSTEQVNQLRGSLSVTTTEAVGLVTQLNKMGQGGRPLAEISKEFIRLSAVTGESLPALTQNMVTLQRQMGVEGLENTRKYTATLASLSEQAGVSANGVLEFANAITPVSQMAGMGMKEVLGFSTAFNKAGADGYAAANAYSKMVNDISRAIQFGGPQLAGYANLLGVNVEQLKQMPVAESVTQVFEAIANEGPRAQKILEQFGLDGMRTYRAIAAVSQRGDIRGNMRIAGEDSVESFAQAAEKALGGVNDQLTIFSNNLTRTGQAIGATFLPPMELLLKVVNLLSGGLAAISESVGAIPALGMALAGGGALAAGTAVRGAGLIAGAAGVQMFRRSAFRAGLQSARSPLPLDRQPGWWGRYARNFDAGDPRLGFFQRGTFALGQQIGQRLPAGVAGEGGLIRQTGRVAQYGLAQSIRGAGYLIRQPFMPLFGDRYSDIANRDQIGGRGWGGSTTGAQRMFIQGRADATDARGTLRQLGREFRDIARGTRELNTEQRRYSTVLRAMTTETGRYVGGVTRAGFGASRMVGRGLAGAVGTGLGMLGSTGILSMVGITGAIAGAGAIRESAITGERARTSTEDTSGAAKYESALGLASRATMSFADAVNQARDEIIGGSPGGSVTDKLTAADAKRATSPTYRYTFPELKDMSREGIASWVSVNRGTMDPEALGAAKYDVLSRFGGDVDLVNELFSAAPDVRGRWSSTDNTGVGFWGRLLGVRGGSTVAEFASRRSESDRLRGMASEGDLQNVNFGVTNQQLLGIRDLVGSDRDAMWSPMAAVRDSLGGRRSRRLSGLDELANTLNAYEKSDVAMVNRAYNKAARAGNSDDEVISIFWAELAQGDESSDLTQMAKTAVEAGDSGYRTLEALTRKADEDPFRFWGSSPEMRERLSRTSLGRSLMPQPLTGLQGVPQEAWESTRWRGEGATTRRGISEAISAFLENPDDVRLQDRATLSMAEGLNEVTGGFRETQNALIQFRNSVQDVNDPLYQLANAALEVSRLFEQRDLIGATRAEQMAVTRNRLRDAEMRYRQNPNDLEAARDRLDALAEDTAMLESFDSYVRNTVRSIREMEISFGQQKEDFNRSKERSDYEFGLGRERATADFGRARRLQDEARDRSVFRAWRDFNISRERSEYEFGLSRTRQEEAYGRQLTRAWRDFNIQRERSEYEFNLSRSRQQDDYERQRRRALYDFNLQRRRQEEDFNHQLVLMAENSARQMYNIYERVAVQRTLSGQNLIRNMEDQINRMTEQQENLARVRQLGLSDDAIRMLGLNEATGAQQLKRLLTELTPEMIAKINQQTTERTDAAGALVTDPSNQQYAEMVRQYELGRERAAEDFNLSMDRMSEDFQRAIDRSHEDFERSRKNQFDDFTRSLRDQRTEFDISMRQAAEDFARSRKNQFADFMRSLDDQAAEYAIQTAEQQFQFNQAQDRQLQDYNRRADQALEDMDRMQKRARDSFFRAHEEITGDLADLWKEAHGYLQGESKKQLEAMGRSLGIQASLIKGKVGDLGRALKDAFKDLGLSTVVFNSNQGGSDKTKNQVKAEGGTIEGVSSHRREDNIPIWATAGEFMQPVDSVEHYGVDVMEKMRRRQIPKEAFEGYATGGFIDGRRLANPALLPSLVAYGRTLQKEGFQVGEHPLFGGVHPGAHAPTSRGGLHYIGHALDINYDGFGQAVENRMIDNIIKEVERRGFGYIWRSANHYDHLHIDTAARRQLNGRTWFNGDPLGGMLASIATDKTSGKKYLTDLYEQLQENRHFKYFEDLMAIQKLTRSRFRKNSLARAGAVLGYETLMEGLEDYGEGNEPFTVPGGVERWRPMVERALRMMGQSTGLADITLRRMNQESSGNPRAINLWDINAKRGTPSKGLMQVIDPTFAAYAVSPYNRDIWDPLSNILASMNYAINRYGGLYPAYSRAGGYALGGLVNPYGDGAIFSGAKQITVGERGPEMVMPLYGRGIEFINEVINRNRQADHRETFVRHGIPEVSKQIVYNSSYDHSTHYTGEITVVAQDPDEMQRKLAAKRRQDALIGRRTP